MGPAQCFSRFKKSRTPRMCGEPSEAWQYQLRRTDECSKSGLGSRGGCWWRSGERRRKMNGESRKQEQCVVKQARNREASVVMAVHRQPVGNREAGGQAGGRAGGRVWWLRGGQQQVRSSTEGLEVGGLASLEPLRLALGSGQWAAPGQGATARRARLFLLDVVCCCCCCPVSSRC